MTKLTDSQKKLIEVEEKCPDIGKDAHNHPANPCSHCHGTGTITHPADREALWTLIEKNGRTEKGVT